MSPTKSNMVRSICRSLEVLLFFVISVVGFNLFAKTTSLNSKTKAKALSGGPVAPRELSVSGITLHCNLIRLNSFFISPQRGHTSSLTAPSGDNHFSITANHHHSSLSYCSTDQNHNDRHLLSPLSLPGNLFQQNLVLLI